MVSTQTKWQLSGDYFENCNCEFLCPCLLSGMQAPPTEGPCDVPLAFHIERGRFGETSLDGLNAVIALHTPGIMAAGDWTVAAYLDERADDAQRQALGAIFGGSAGGPIGALAPLIATNLGAAFVPITYNSDGKRRSVTIPGVLEMSVEGVPGANRAEPAYLDNVGHPAATRLAAAKGTGMSYTDHGMSWDNTGKNAHYAQISWSNG